MDYTYGLTSCTHGRTNSKNHTPILTTFSTQMSSAIVEETAKSKGSYSPLGVSGATYDDCVLSFTLHPDGFRFVAYSWLVLTLGVGFAITSTFNLGLPEDTESPWRPIDPTNNTLYNHFGYNNVCLYIDDLPAKYIAIWIAVLFIICYVAYLLLSLASYYLCEKRGRISRSTYNWYKATVIFDIMIVTYFVEVFAVHPDENFPMHTIPFTCLVVSVCITGIRNVLFELQVIDFTKHPKFKIALKVYLAGLVIASILKIMVQFYGIILIDPFSVTVSKMSDNAWMLFALVIPWIKSGCSSFDSFFCFGDYDKFFPRVSGVDDHLVITMQNPLVDIRN